MLQRLPKPFRRFLLLLLLASPSLPAAESPFPGPRGEKLDVLTRPDLWEHDRKLFLARFVKVTRDQVVAFALYTHDHGTLKLTAQLFPLQANARFDWDVYAKEHLPLARERLTPYGLLDITAQRCAKGPGGAEPTNTMIVTLNFANEDDFKKAFTEAAPELIAHVEKFTDIRPIFHFGAVVE